MLESGAVLGPYRILDLVAVGGMGEVYRAEDSRLHREIAIKVLPPHLAADRSALDRFRREARAVAALSHPNILAIFDVGDENGIHYAVTELLEGETLRKRLLRGPMELRETLLLLLEIAKGVAAAHERGIVHRDLKPENIFLTREGRVKVLDFGLARSATGAFAARGDHAPAEMLPTEPGVVLGTVGYLAPEQVEARSPTPATDVFALGCILYEAIAGTVPFDRDSSAHSMVALLRDDPPRLPHGGDALLRDVDALIQRSLEKDPEDRPRDAGELAIELRALAGGERLSQAFRATARVPAARSMLPRVLAAIAGVLFVAAIVAGFVRVHGRQLDHGFDLRASDVRGDGETKRLVAIALRADADGNRAKAMELLEEANRRSSVGAFPAAFLASFLDASGNFAEADRWRRIAMQRLERGAGTYESLLARYLATPNHDQAHELALAKSAIEVRPDAWRLRLAAAHIHLGQRDREAARRELQGIDPRKPDDRRLVLVLADRASLGDIDGAERDLLASRLVQRPALLHYTQARIAWSRGDVARAQRLYDRAADEAAADSHAPMETESRLHAGIAFLRLGRWDEAQRRFGMTANRARQAGLTHRIFEASAFAAYAADRAGDPAERDRKLAAAMAVDPPAEPSASLRLLALRTGSDVWRSWSDDAIAKSPLLQATLLLIRAREAQRAGDALMAAQLLRRARAENIDGSGDREEAELLAAELGLPSQRLPADPPYPNSLRYLAIFDYPHQPESR